MIDVINCLNKSNEKICIVQNSKIKFVVFLQMVISGEYQLIKKF